MRDLKLRVTVKVALTPSSRAQAPLQAAAARFEAGNEIVRAEALVKLEAPLELVPEVFSGFGLN